jgi:hypothetical protein
MFRGKNNKDRQYSARILMSILYLKNKKYILIHKKVSSAGLLTVEKIIRIKSSILHAGHLRILFA